MTAFLLKNKTPFIRAAERLAERKNLILAAKTIVGAGIVAGACLYMAARYPGFSTWLGRVFVTSGSHL